jgi:hypothetical protein
MSDTIIIVPNPDNAGDSIQITEGGGGAVNSVNGRIGDVLLTSNDVGLGSVSNEGYTSLYTTVNSNSAGWALSGGAGGSVYLPASANWNSCYSTVNTSSAIWNLGGNSTVLQSNSANWNSVYSYVNSNSSIEYNQTAATSFVLVNSSKILSVDSLVANSSANWNSVYSDVNLLSTSWIGGNVAYNNLVANSSLYLETNVNGTIYQIEVTRNQDGSATLSLPQSLRTPGDLNVGGSLYVAGSSLTLNTATLSVSSPIIYLNNSLSGITGNLFDIGLVGNFNNGLYQHTGLVRSAEHNYWSLFSGLTSEPNEAPTLNYNDPTFTIDTLRANILGSVFGDVSAKSLIAGNDNHLNASNSFILGSGITANQDNTTFIQNLSAQGIVNTTGLALYNSRVQFLERPVTANGKFIILNVNGEVQAIRLFTPIIVGVNFQNSTEDGDWSNVLNWTDINGYPVTYLPDVESNIDLYNSVTQVSDGLAKANSVDFFNNASWSNGSTLHVVNSAVFHQTSTFGGTLSGDGIFLDNSSNIGTINGYALFGGNSVNSGFVSKNVVFIEGATNQNSAGVVGGNAIVYYPSPYPIGGLVSGSVSYRGYFATKFVGTAGDGDWNNLANWRDDFDLPVVFLPTASSVVKIYANVTTASGNSVTVNRATFYNNSVWGAGLTMNASQVTLRQQSSNEGTLVGNNGSLFKLYDYATNFGTIDSDVEVNHPCPNPIGGTVVGSVSYIGYVTPIISPKLVNIQGPNNITSISLTCNGNDMYPNFDITTEDYGVVTGASSNQQVNYSLTINGNTTTGTINVDQALQIYNTTNIYYIRFINSAIPRPTIVSGPLPGYVPGYYTIGQNDYLPIIYNHNGVPVWYTNYPAISLHKGSDRNRVMIHFSNTPHKTVYIGPSSLNVATYQLLQYPGSWDIHEGQEISGPPNRKGNIMGHVYTTGFYLEEQTPNNQLVWNWEADDYYSGGWADYYHNNSVDVHPINGNILLSNRHNAAAICVDFNTKKVKWVVSGRYPLNGTGTMEAADRNTSGTLGTKYISEAHSNLLNEPTYSGYQYSGTVGNHDARWHIDIPPIHGPNNVVYSIYDDESPNSWGFGSNTAPAARGVIYEVDESAGVAYHRSSVFSPYGSSPYRGSYTVVHEDDGTWSHVLDNVVQNPVMLEFVGNIDTPNKPLVLEMQFYSNDPYRIIKIKKSFFDLNNLRATYGMSVN